MWLGMAERRGRARSPACRSRPLNCAQRAAARLHRPGRRLVRGARAGPSVDVRPRRRRPGRLLRWRSPARSRCLRLAPPRAAWRRRGRAPAVARRSAIGPSAAGRLARCGRSSAAGAGGARGRGSRRRRRAARPPPGLRVEVLDVGQGDAILLQPAGAPAVLVDGGPPGDGLAGEAARRPGSSGSAPRSSPTTSPTTPAGSRSCSVASRSAGSSTRRLRPRPARPRPRRPAPRRCGSPRAASCAPAACGSTSSGRRASCSPSRSPGADPNQLALVLLARWHASRCCSRADAEAEAVPLDPGPVDVLKVAHHGSDDAGLGACSTAPGRGWR